MGLPLQLGYLLPLSVCLFFFCLFVCPLAYSESYERIFCPLLGGGGGGDRPHRPSRKSAPGLLGRESGS